MQYFTWKVIFFFLEKGLALVEVSHPFPSRGRGLLYLAAIEISWEYTRSIIRISWKSSRVYRVHSVYTLRAHLWMWYRRWCILHLVIESRVESSDVQPVHPGNLSNRQLRCWNWSSSTDDILYVLRAVWLCHRWRVSLSECYSVQGNGRIYSKNVRRFIGVCGGIGPCIQNEGEKIKKTSNWSFENAFLHACCDYRSRRSICTLNVHRGREEGRGRTCERCRGKSNGEYKFVRT